MMRRRASLVLAATLATISGSGCHGIGRPLVGNSDVEDDGKKNGFCVLAPACDDPGPGDVAAEVDSLRRDPVDLALCGFQEQPCVPRPDPFGVLTNGQCAVEAKTSKELAVLLGQVFDCSSLKFALVPAKDASQMIPLDNLELRHTELHVHTSEPARLHLYGTLIDDARIVLDGPVTLHIERPRQLQGLRVLATDTMDSGARFELANAAGDDVSIAGETSPFPGDVLIESSNVTRLRVEARQINLTTTGFTTSSLQADTLETNDATLAHVALTVGDARLRSSRLDHVVTSEGNSLMMLTSDAVNTRLAACATPMQIWGGTLDNVIADGEIYGIHAEFRNCIFGSESVTDLDAWDSHVFVCNFCKHARTTKLGASAFVRCPSCDPDANLRVCSDKTGEQDIQSSQCDEFISPIDCGAALPDRPKMPK